MRLKNHHVATQDEVRITREWNAAIIEVREPEEDEKWPE
mgnify:CR=1 FL=1